MAHPQPPRLPLDRGQLYTLRSLVATASDELRRQGTVIGGIVDFTTSNLPEILRSISPLTLKTWSGSLMSPYPFEIRDLSSMPDRPEVFAGTADLLSGLDLPRLSGPLVRAELIGIDESQVEAVLPHSTLAYLKTIAFRMFAADGRAPDEAVGPILSEFRTQIAEDESFESENKMLSYIRNNYVAFMSLITAVSFQRTPYVVLHGPLVRTIGGFSHLIFDYETCRKLLSLDWDLSGEVERPAAGPIFSRVGPMAHNLSSDAVEAADGHDNLREFNEFCINICHRQCAAAGVYPTDAVPPDVTAVTDEVVTRRRYPAYCLYFWGLRSLADAEASVRGSSVMAVVDDISASTETMRLVLPSTLAAPTIAASVHRSPLKSALASKNIVLETRAGYEGRLYRQAQELIDLFRLSDSNVFTYLLSEAQFTAPVEVYRYRTRNTFVQTLSYGELGTRDEFEPILQAVFPPGTNPGGYRVVSSYLRTTPLREPVRLEFFDSPDKDYLALVGSAFLLSLPYAEYGIPLILYYADRMARTPIELVRTIVEREYMDLVLRGRFSDPVSVLRVLGRLNRNYFEREGV